MSESETIGGQAVIEGVMMRTPHTYTVAVRTPSGDITVRKNTYSSLTRRYKFLNLPLIRGFLILIETLYIGISALSYSGEVALQAESGSAPTEERKTTFRDKLSLIMALVFAFAFGIVLFTLVPYFLSELFQNKLQLTRDSVSFNVIAGLIRVFIFLVYLFLITRMKDIQRVFEYHGAEHKSIHVLEAHKPLSVENAQHYSTKHPRCGTSFLLVVLLAAICIYIVFDSVMTVFLGSRPTLLFRILSHIAILPFIAGTAFEFIKWSGKFHAGHKWVRLITLPGHWLQKITTREPSADQLEVAFAALKEALKLEKNEFSLDLFPSVPRD
ncbi:DUF1385 domain-containing protein [bacterium]|nr:DUF1385 domain-containing protein [bacterium]